MYSSDESTSAESVTPRSSVSPSPLGCPRKSLVWDHFVFDSSSGKSLCQVPDSSTEDAEDSSSPVLCGHVIPGKFPSNLRQHLKSRHGAVYQKLLQSEEKQKEEREALKHKSTHGPTPIRTQRTLGEIVKSQRKYEKESLKYQTITQKLAIFIASSSVPNSIVENEEFRSLILTLDPRYQVPSRSLISVEIDRVLLDLKEKIQSYLMDAQKVSICADVWTKKGMTTSYLGLTAHFFCRRDLKRHVATIAVRRLPHPHTADNIKTLMDTVLLEWEIPLNKVEVVITDNASNMVKAFKLALESSCEDGEVEEEEEEDEIVDENIDFEEKEFDHDITFKFYCKRVGCFAHTLQLVMQKFNQDQFKPLLKKVHSLVAKINRSSKATELLISLAQKKLVKDCPTRWSSTYLMIERLCELKVHVTTVLEQQGWDNLAHSEWRLVENLCGLLKPFAVYTQLVSSEESTTISSSLPVLMELNLHLEDTKKTPELAAISSLLQSELKKRFRKCTDPGDEFHEPLYIASTLLDPRYKPLLNPTQLSSAKVELLKMLKDSNGSSSESSSVQSGSPSTRHHEDPPPTKKYRFSHLSKVLEEKAKEGLHKVSKRPPGELEMESYVENIHAYPDDNDPLSFWIQNQEKYPAMASVAFDVLTIPGSSAPVERVFSTAGHATMGKRNRLTDQNLEREVIIRKNKKYLNT